MGGLGPVERSARSVLRPGRPAARPRPDRGRDAARRPRPASVTRRSPATRARSRSAPGRATPPTRRPQTGGVGWILAVDWVPYQLPTFVTPSFQGYVSGHSTFSRAAAEVMTAFTGSEYFPGGSSAGRPRPGSLKVEAGPTADVTLQWATYYDAADQAGQSRLYGGIHIPADDFNGRSHRVAVRQGGVGARAAATSRAPGPPLTRRSVSRRRPGRPSSGRRDRRRGGGFGWRRLAAPRCHADRRRSGRRASSMRRPRRASHHRYDGESPTSGRRRRRRLRLRRRRPARTCTSPAATQPGRALPERQPVGGALRFTPIADPVTDLDRRHRRLPARHRRRRDASTSRAPARGESVAAARASATAGSSGPTRRWAFDGGDGHDDGVQRDLGGRSARCRRSRSATTCDSTPTGSRRPTVRRQRRCSGPAADGIGVRAAHPADARATAPCRCCSATGTAPGDATSGSATTAQYYARDGQEQLWRDRAGRAAAPVHGGRRLGPMPDRGDGHREPGPDRRRLPGGLPDQPGRRTGSRP